MQIASACRSKKKPALSKQAGLKCEVRLPDSKESVSVVHTQLMFVLTCVMQWGGRCIWGGCNQANGFQGGCHSDVSSPLFSLPFSQ